MSATSKDFLTEADAQVRYNEEAASYQKQYNATHTVHIWKHGYYDRTLRFMNGSEEGSVTVRVTRFIIQGTHKTFTFYGSLLLYHTQYSFSYLKRWISARPRMLSLSVTRRWETTILRGQDPARISRLNC